MVLAGYAKQRAQLTTKLAAVEMVRYRAGAALTTIKARMFNVRARLSRMERSTNRLKEASDSAARRAEVGHIQQPQPQKQPSSSSPRPNSANIQQPAPRIANILHASEREATPSLSVYMRACERALAKRGCKGWYTPSPRV
jgi:hypothetical protein